MRPRASPCGTWCDGASSTVSWVRFAARFGSAPPGAICGSGAATGARDGNGVEPAGSELTRGAGAASGVG